MFIVFLVVVSFHINSDSNYQMLNWRQRKGKQVAEVNHTIKYFDFEKFVHLNMPIRDASTVCVNADLQVRKCTIIIMSHMQHST